ncbi:MAG: hypothetical protein R2881_03160 [Eubacteriales bacterium]
MAVCYALYALERRLIFRAHIRVYFYTKSTWLPLVCARDPDAVSVVPRVHYALFSRSKHKSLLLFIVLAVWLALSILLKNTLREDLTPASPNRIPIFLIGVYCGQRMKDGDDILPRWFPIAAGVMLLLGVFLAYLTNVMKMELLFHVSNAAFPNLLLTLGIVFLVPGFAKRVIRRELSPVKTFFGFFGSISPRFISHRSCFSSIGM